MTAQGSALRRVALVLGTIGLLIALYLTVLHYSTVVPLVCSQSGLVNCERVITSPQSVWFGAPVAGVGFAWFVVTLVWWLRSGPAAPPWLAGVRLGWAVLGAVTVVYLVYVELVELRHLCLWCSGLHVIILTLLVLSILAHPTRRPAS
ncbi:MAG: vitamin K epoxide reductase family protein [Thermaerobacter sp.]|nr:vitamin K epoxide reductase family protein [Thermaerobacter sp.]